MGAGEVTRWQTKSMGFLSCMIKEFWNWSSALSAPNPHWVWSQNHTLAGLHNNPETVSKNSTSPKQHFFLMMIIIDRKITYWEKIWAIDFPDSSVGKQSACNIGDSGWTPGSGRSPGEGIGYPLHYSWAYLVAQLVKNLPAMQETGTGNSWVGKILWRRERLPTQVFWPGEFHGLYSSWGCKESDTTEWLSLHMSRK